MRPLFIFIAVFMLTIQSMAQPPHRHKFDAERFQAELEQFITIEAAITPQEAEIFFPIYREMRKQQLALFGQMRRYRFTDTSDDKAAMEAIRHQDKLDIEIKELQQKYHNKFMKLLPASKVLKIIKAEDKFHRKQLRSKKNGR